MLCSKKMHTFINRGSNHRLSSDALTSEPYRQLGETVVSTTVSPGALPEIIIFFFGKVHILFIGRSFYRNYFISFKTLVYNGKRSRNRMALEFLHFGYFPARNKLRSSK